jgi:hypothetical protein
MFNSVQMLLRCRSLYDITMSNSRTNVTNITMKVTMATITIRIANSNEILNII